MSPKLAEAIEGVCPSGDVKSTFGAGDAADENVLHDDAGILA
jgi:hypothetical protein